MNSSPAHIGHIMVREEICVDRNAQGGEPGGRRVRLELQVEQGPCAAQIAADARVHEAGEQRHRGDAEEAFFWIDPGADGGLEDFHHRPDHVVGGDDLGLLDRLQPETEQRHLQDERREEEKVVARQCRIVRIEEIRRQAAGTASGRRTGRPMPASCRSGGIRTARPLRGGGSYAQQCAPRRR